MRGAVFVDFEDEDFEGAAVCSSSESEDITIVAFEALRLLGVDSVFETACAFRLSILSRMRSVKDAIWLLALCSDSLFALCDQISTRLSSTLIQ